MHLSHPLAGALTLLLTTTTVVASPAPVAEDQSSNPAPLHKRYTLGNSLGSLFYGNNNNNEQCTSPSQINLKNDPGIITTSSGSSDGANNGLANLQHGCGWKMWAACAAVAGGFCVTSCTAAAATDGFAAPACAACIATLGGMHCGSCISNEEIQQAQSEFYVEHQDQIVRKMQSTYCEVPKKDMPRLQLQGASTPEASSASTA